MQYYYEVERLGLVSPKGIEVMTMVAFAARQWIGSSGAFTMRAMWEYVGLTATAHEWLTMACVDYMVEAKLLLEVTQEDDRYAHRTFVIGPKFKA